MVARAVSQAPCRSMASKGVGVRAPSLKIHGRSVELEAASARVAVFYA